jgi:hypothetical protein
MFPKISLIVAFLMIVAAPVVDASVRVDSSNECRPPSRSVSFVVAEQSDHGPSEQNQPESNPQDSSQDDQNLNAEQGQVGDGQDSQGAGAPEQVVPNEVRVPEDDSSDLGATMTPYQQPVNPYQ